MSLSSHRIGRKLGVGIVSILIAVAVINASSLAILRFAGRASDAQDQVLSLSRLVMASGAAGTILFALFVGWWLFRTIVRPVLEMNEVMKKLAGGDLTGVVPFAGRKDEIGEMAQAIEFFKEESIKKQKKKAWEEESIKAWEKENEEKAAKEAEEARQDQIAISGLAAGLGG